MSRDCQLTFEWCCRCINKEMRIGRKPRVGHGVGHGLAVVNSPENQKNNQMDIKTKINA